MQNSDLCQVKTGLTTSLNTNRAIHLRESCGLCDEQVGVCVSELSMTPVLSDLGQNVSSPEGVSIDGVLKAGGDGTSVTTENGSQGISGNGVSNDCSPAMVSGSNTIENSLGVASASEESYLSSSVDNGHFPSRCDFGVKSIGGGSNSVEINELSDG